MAMAEMSDGSGKRRAARSVASRHRDRVHYVRTISRYMTDYDQRAVFQGGFNGDNSEKEIVNYLIDLATDVYVIMRARNPGAHADIMPMYKAEACNDYLIKVRKLLCHFLEKIKPEYATEKGFFIKDGE